MSRIILDIIIMAVVATVVWYGYTTYGEKMFYSLFGNKTETIYIESMSLRVVVADSAEERVVGLSGVKELPELEGKLFIFDREGDYGMWMKDMLIPLDIIWIDNNFKIVHIAHNVKPDTYPQVFRSPTAARFVLEVNAFFAESFKLKVGDNVTIPAGSLPTDLRDRLSEE